MIWTVFLWLSYNKIEEMRLDREQKMKEILKILIGAAWIDGVIQPEERKYLRYIAQEFKLAEDPEIKPLLSELRPIQPTECYDLLEDYFGDNHSPEDYVELLEKISALIYSDGYVDIREAKLIEKVKNFDPAMQSNQTIFNRLLRRIQKLYRQAVEQHV